VAEGRRRGSEGAPVLLLWGGDEFLLREAAREALASRELNVTEVDASEWRGGETSDLATPSLWGERRGLLVAGCQAIGEAGARELRDYVAAPVDDTMCVITWVTHGKGAPAFAKAVQAGGGAVRQVAVGRKDLPRWVLERGSRHGVRLTPAAGAALVSAMGEEPAILDQAVRQLAVAFPGRPVGPEEVRLQFDGLGEQRVWDLCDHALAGRTPQALVVLRSMLAAREDPLLILGGIGSRVRDLIRVRALGDRRGSTNDIAREAGLRFDWQLRRYREQAGRFSPEELAVVHDRVVEADRALKGGMAGEIVLASLVNVLAGDRTAGLDVPVRVSR
jgi:DNA polymerase III subunit delta